MNDFNNCKLKIQSDDKILSHNLLSSFFYFLAHKIMIFVRIKDIFELIKQFQLVVLVTTCFFPKVYDL